MIDSLDDLRSARMVYRNGELFNPPALTNFVGSLQAAYCVTGVQHLTFPPFSHGDAVLGGLTVNNVCIRTCGLPISYVWRPDRITRSVDVGALEIKSTTVMGVMSQSCAVRIEIENTADESVDVNVRLQVGTGVTKSSTGWKTPYSPKEGGRISVTPWEGTPPAESLVENRVTPLESGDGLLLASSLSEAFALQGTSTPPDRIDRSFLDFSFALSPGEKRRLHYFVGIDSDVDALQRQFAEWKEAPDRCIAAAEADWVEEIRSVFEPGNKRYSGHLPRLRTSNRDLARIYLNSILGVVYHKRLTSHSAYGRTYVTLMPRYWVTTSFINDWSMSAWLLAMLDPECLRDHIEMWLRRDLYSHFGTEYVSGDNAGNWYSCNDFAMLRLISAYVRVTGDRRWLRSKVGGQSILDHCVSLAMHYRDLDKGSGLADYGDRNSLLEAVGSYTNEVASLNAANVWNLREVARMLESESRVAEAESMKTEADKLAVAVNKLYREGTGYFAVRRPDGEEVPVRHAWDFVHVSNFMARDLPSKQVEEMMAFFTAELLSPSWMAALSPLDEDIDFSVRPDHEWNGSWPGWVALAACSLVVHDRLELLEQWLPGLARSANQGPFSQAHFVESYARPIEGGARKAPTEWPFITDWATVCVGGFFELVLLALFGVDAGYEAIEARPRIAAIDADARLEGIRASGRTVDIGADGRIQARE
ncbi:MAG: hypothetical protein R2832_00935 [Rhodothermales bacterium]